MFVTTGRITQDLGILGLSIRVARQGDEVLVEPFGEQSANLWQVVSGPTRGSIIPGHLLSFDL